MAEKSTDFEAPLQAILQRLESNGVPHVLIGGLAVSQLARPRLTANIDILAYLDQDNRIAPLLMEAARYGCHARIDDPEGFARRGRMLLLVHRQTGIHIDISLGLLPFEKDVISRREIVYAGTLRLPLPAVEDLVILKAVAHRSVDLQDIPALLPS